MKTATSTAQIYELMVFGDPHTTIIYSKKPFSSVFIDSLQYAFPIQGDMGNWKESEYENAKELTDCLEDKGLFNTLGVLVMQEGETWERPSFYLKNLLDSKTGEEIKEYETAFNAYWKSRIKFCEETN